MACRSVFLLLSVAVCGGTLSGRALGASPSLSDLAEQAGLTLGVAVAHPSLLREPEVARLVALHFRAVTPENAMKWAPIAHQPGARDTAAADALVGWALERGMTVKGHALVWDQEIPAWLDPQGDPGLLRGALDAHVQATLDEYGASVLQWDVVNEALNAQGQLAPTPFLRAFGPEHLDRSFREVHAQVPDALLLYNDFGVSDGGPKTAGMLKLIQGMVSRDVPIGGVGLQSHLSVGQDASVLALQRTLHALHGMGLTVHISELDVRIGEAAGAQWGREAAQGWLYHRTVRACIESPACDQITVWGLHDGDHWTTRDGAAREGPLLFDRDLQPKMAFEGVRSALVGEAPAFCAENALLTGTVEEHARGWSAGGGVLERHSDAAHTGTYGLRLSGRDAAWQGPVVDLQPIVGEGLPWRAGLWVRHHGTTSQPVKLTLHLQDALGDRYLTLTEARAAPGQWVSLDATWTPALRGELVRADLYVEGPDPGVTIDVDDAVVGVVCPKWTPFAPR